jgi:hypothetical protein
MGVRVELASLVTTDGAYLARHHRSAAIPLVRAMTTNLFLNLVS